MDLATRCCSEPKPNFQNRFVKKLTRERVVHTMLFCISDGADSGRYTMAIKPKCSEVSRIQTVVTEIVRLSQEQSELLKVPLHELREIHLEGHRRRQREEGDFPDNQTLNC